MKKLALIASLALVAALALSCGDKNTVHINAVVDELKDQDSVSILMVDYGSSTFDMKKYPLQNGVLDVTLPLDRPRMASLRNPANPNMSLIGFPVARNPSFAAVSTILPSRAASSMRTTPLPRI